MATVPSANSTVWPSSRSSGSVVIGAGQLVGIVARSWLGGEAELGAEVALDDVAGDRPQADLGPAQVLQHGELTAHLLADRPDRRERGGVLLVRAVREVEPEDVDARLDQLPEHGRVARGRPDRRHDLGPDLAQRLKMVGRHGGCRASVGNPRPRSLRWVGLVAYRIILAAGPEGIPLGNSEKKAPPRTMVMGTQVTNQKNVWDDPKIRLHDCWHSGRSKTGEGNHETHEIHEKD